MAVLLGKLGAGLDVAGLLLGRDTLRTRISAALPCRNETT